jgi:hypothetical protein
MCQLKHADYQRVLQDLSPRKRGNMGTRHFGDVGTNLHANLQSTIGSKKGPVFKRAVEHTILREALVENIRQLIIPAEEGLYSLIIGEHGTGKTSLIKLTVSDMDEPKGIVYADIADDEADEAYITQVMREAVGWSPDPLIDSSQRNCCIFARGFTSFFPYRHQVSARVWETTGLNNRQCEQSRPEASRAS